MSRRKTGKNISFIPEGRDKPQSGEISYVHPQGRYLQVTYQVQTPMGISAPIRECLRIVQGRVWTGLDGTPK